MIRVPTDLFYNDTTEVFKRYSGVKKFASATPEMEILKACVVFLLITLLMVTAVFFTAHNKHLHYAYAGEKPVPVGVCHGMATWLDETTIKCERFAR